MLAYTPLEDHVVNEDGEVVPRRIIIAKGTRRTLQVIVPTYRQRKRGLRGPIKHFSRRARLLMLRTIAGIDWMHVGKSAFITFTYPDEVLPRLLYDRVTDRKLTQRYIEREIGRRIAGCFRWEWVPRKTGALVGQVHPHLHMLVFDLPYIPYENLRTFWERRIGATSHVQVKVKYAKKNRVVSMYIAKYAAKLNDQSILDNDSNGNTLGRSYGWMRLSQIPRYDIVEAGPIPASLAAEIRHLAEQWTPELYRGLDIGCTLLGDRIALVDEILRQAGLTYGSTVG
jgi:hypothetical protein